MILRQAAKNTKKEEDRLDAFRELARNVAGLDNSIPIAREESPEIWNRPQKYHRKYPKQ